MNEEPTVFCETCHDFHTSLFHKEIFPFYENYRLCQIKGFFENMPYMTLTDFMRTCIRIKRYIYCKVTDKLMEENKNIHTYEEYNIRRKELLAEKGEMTYDEFIKLSKHVNERYNKLLKGKKVVYLNFSKLLEEQFGTPKNIV